MDSPTALRRAVMTLKIRARHEKNQDDLKAADVLQRLLDAIEGTTYTLRMHDGTEP